jgi:hypothetical protein
MKDLEKIREQIITIVVLSLTIALSSSNLNLETINEINLANQWLLPEVID